MQKKTGPFLRTSITIESVMTDVLISLIPALAAGVIFFGWRALWVVFLSTIAAMATETLLLRKPLTLKGFFGDGSAAVTGLLLGLILPSTVSWWIPVVGSIIAIALVKLAFGGLGANIFNPALGARAILLLAFTSQMVKFTLPFDTVTSATPLLTMPQFDWSLVWGNVGGSIGETSVIAILLGAAYLLYKGHIDWRVPVGYVGAAFAAALIWGLDPWMTITAGGLLFAAVFMATDMVTSPVTPTGQLLFGVGCGLLTVLIRKFTPFPEGVTFAILTMNAFVPLLDRITIPSRFGVGIPRETRFQATVGAVIVVIIAGAALYLLNDFQPSVQPVISQGNYLPIADVLGTTDYSIEEIDGNRYYVVRDDEGTLERAAFVAEQKGFNAPIEFLLALDNELVISAIDVLDHEEDPGLGSLITRRSFLDQFLGLNQTSSFSLGKDIDGITGATISSRAFTTGVSRALERFIEAFFPSEESVGGWVDGTYTGSADSFGGTLEVDVTVSGGQISDVTVLSHSDTPGISDGAFDNIPQRIVEANQPKVDAVSGATVSSEGIMKAVENALQSAVSDAPSGTAALSDGTYTGTADSFGGGLEVEVIVSGGQISDVTVLSHSDTPGISDGAVDNVPQRIVEANQAQVDIHSGATVTSKAIMDAVENALQSSSSDSPAASFDIAVSDGTYRGVGEGFGGDIEVEVTVSGGKIADIAVISHNETPFVAGAAIDEIVPAMVEAQGPVDAYSGATLTSQGLLEAVENALSGDSPAADDGAALGEWSDGTYTGTADSFGGTLEVEVTVSGGQISDITILSHSDTPGISDGAFDNVPQRIVEANQAQVDIHSGATVSSKAIMEAVENALQSSSSDSPAASFDIAVSDGTYRGVGEGFGGDIEVEVTVSGGKIADIAVISHNETPFVAGAAIDELVPAMVEAQGSVDVYSGATLTSNGLIEAVKNAVSGKEGQ